MKKRFIRAEEPLEDQARLVVRGGRLRPDVVPRDASRLQLIYGVRGISVFAIVSASLAEMAQQPPPVRFAELSIIEVSKLRSGGFGIEPTGRNPRHYTLVLGDLAEAVDRLCALEHDVWPNPYHEADA